MSNPMIRIHNVEINEVIDREMTDEETEQYNAEQAIYVAELAHAKEKAAARQVIFDRLGLTAEEAALLLG